MIAVQEKHELPDYRHWTRKSGVWHCEPPTHVLEKICFAQIYIDDVDDSSGPMSVLEGSHLNGKASQEQIDKLVTTHRPVTCLAKSGDVFWSKSLLVHRSEQPLKPIIRRVLRIDFTNAGLPCPLDWVKL